MKRTELPCYGIVVEADPETGAGTIDPGQLMHHAFHGILSLVLGHACAGVDIAAPAYVEGLETAVEDIDP